ncbi:hypothetical protein [Rhizobium leguminosarum]|uniref:Uncharacterized protein n=1 Tax=Rhizobium leguminosarum TaxID=384 RepID=A0A7K3VEJ2_RHILE|nr:hypothetical protein [Rhizobium leguminosarum]NEK15038.1 hypothetical protein [Rhizobium leguminosarum]
MTSKRGPGRPKGDGINDDLALSKIAWKLASGEADHYGEAAAAVYETDKPKGYHVRKTVLDRWRGKWELRGSAYLEKASASKARVVVRQAQAGVPFPAVDTIRQLYENLPQQMLKRMMDSTPQQQFQQALNAAGLTLDELQERQRQFTDYLCEPLVQDALKRLQSPEFRSTIAELKKYQS